MAASAPRKITRGKTVRAARTGARAPRAAAGAGDDFVYDLPEQVTLDDETVVTSITLPPFKRVAKPGLIRKNRTKSEIDQFFSLLEAALEEGSVALEVLDEHTDLEEFWTVMLAWQEHSGINVGES